MRVSLRRVAALVLTAAAVAGSSGCFGSFHAARKVWQFNKDASKNKFVQEILFLGMNIVPVYQVSGLLDVLIFNTVEFWSGKNPITMASRTSLDGKTQVQTSVSEKNGVRTMEIRGFESDSLTFTTTMNVVPGTELLAIRTVFAGGRTISRVAAMGMDGTPFLVSTSFNSP